MGYIQSEFVRCTVGNVSYGSGAVTDGTYHLIVNVTNYNQNANLATGVHVRLHGLIRRNRHDSIVLQVTNMNDVTIVDDAIMLPRELRRGHLPIPAVARIEENLLQDPQLVPRGNVAQPAVAVHADMRIRPANRQVAAADPGHAEFNNIGPVLPYRHQGGPGAGVPRANGIQIRHEPIAPRQIHLDNVGAIPPNNEQGGPLARVQRDGIRIMADVCIQPSRAQQVVVVDQPNVPQDDNGPVVHEGNNDGQDEACIQKDSAEDFPVFNSAGAYVPDSDEEGSEVVKRTQKEEALKRQMSLIAAELAGLNEDPPRASATVTNRKRTLSASTANSTEESSDSRSRGSTTDKAPKKSMYDLTADSTDSEDD